MARRGGSAGTSARGGDDRRARGRPSHRSRSRASPRGRCRLRTVLDAWALVALLNDEPAAARVEELIAEPDCAASWISLGEVVYIESRRVGEPAARDAIARISEALVAVPVDPGLVLTAASVKAGGGLSYADAFAVATAESRGASLATGDPELLRLKHPDLTLLDLTICDG